MSWFWDVTVGKQNVRVRYDCAGVPQIERSENRCRAGSDKHLTKVSLIFTHLK